MQSKRLNEINCQCPLYLHRAFLNQFFFFLPWLHPQFYEPSIPMPKPLLQWLLRLFDSVGGLEFILEFTHIYPKEEPFDNNYHSFSLRCPQSDAVTYSTFPSFIFTKRKLTVVIQMAKMVPSVPVPSNQ